MTYIKLEDVQKIYREIPYKSDEILDFMDDIYSIPSISFEKMIQEVQDKYWIWNKKIDVLEELLNKLP